MSVASWDDIFRTVGAECGIDCPGRNNNGSGGKSRFSDKQRKNVHLVRGIIDKLRRSAGGQARRVPVSKQLEWVRDNTQLIIKEVKQTIKQDNVQRAVERGDADTTNPGEFKGAQIGSLETTDVDAHAEYKTKQAVTLARDLKLDPVEGFDKTDVIVGGPYMGDGDVDTPEVLGSIQQQVEAVAPGLVPSFEDQRDAQDPNKTANLDPDHTIDDNNDTNEDDNNDGGYPDGPMAPPTIKDAIDMEHRNLVDASTAINRKIETLTNQSRALTTMSKDLEKRNDINKLPMGTFEYRKAFTPEDEAELKKNREHIASVNSRLAQAHQEESDLVVKRIRETGVYPTIIDKHRDARTFADSYNYHYKDDPLQLIKDLQDQEEIVNDTVYRGGTPTLKQINTLKTLRAFRAQQMYDEENPGETDRKRSQTAEGRAALAAQAAHKKQMYHINKTRAYGDVSNELPKGFRPETEHTPDPPDPHEGKVRVAMPFGQEMWVDASERKELPKHKIHYAAPAHQNAPAEPLKGSASKNPKIHYAAPAYQTPDESNVRTTKEGIHLPDANVKPRIQDDPFPVQVREDQGQASLRPLFGFIGGKQVVPTPVSQLRSDLQFDQFSFVQPGFGLGVDNKMFLQEATRDKNIVHMEPQYYPRQWDGPSNGLSSAPWQWQTVKDERVVEDWMTTRYLLERVALNERLNGTNTNSLGDDIGYNQPFSSSALPIPKRSVLTPVINSEAHFIPTLDPAGINLNARHFRPLFDPMRHPQHFAPANPHHGGPVYKKHRAYENILQ